MKRIACVVAGCLFALAATGFAAEDFTIGNVPLATQVAQYNRLIDEKRLDEAVALSEAMSRQHPSDPVVQLLREHARLLQVVSEKGIDPDLPVRHLNLISRIYSVADIITPVPESGDTPAPEITEADYQPLMTLIETYVSPSTWSANRPGAMRPYVETKSLVVRQTPAVHEEIADVLQVLRGLRSASITVEVQSLTTMGSTGILRFFGLENENPTTVSSTQIAEMLERIPEKMRKQERLESAPKITLANGQAGTVETPGTQHETLKLRIEPLADTNAGLQLRVSNEDAPENAVTLNLKSGQSAIIDMRRLAGPQPRTIADMATREISTRGSTRRLIIITPTVSYRSEAVEQR